MTNKQLKNLKDTLWTTADQLRANSGLKSTEYAEPILGLIFLRFADVKYSKFEPEIKAEFDSIKGTRIVDYDREFSVKNVIIFKPETMRDTAYLYYWMTSSTMQEIFGAQTNTPRKYFSRCGSFLCIAVVDVFILFFPQFFPK